jgi:hypothetical protein
LSPNTRVFNRSTNLFYRDNYNFGWAKGTMIIGAIQAAILTGLPIFGPIISLCLIGFFLLTTLGGAFPHKPERFGIIFGIGLAIFLAAMSWCWGFYPDKDGGAYALALCALLAATGVFLLAGSDNRINRQIDAIVQMKRPKSQPETDE